MRRDESGFEGEPTETDSVVTLVKQTADGLGRLITEHLKLARLELAEEARAAGRQLGLIALFAPFIAIGYALGCIGVALAISRWVGLPGAFLTIAALNFIIGGLGLYLSPEWLRRRGVLAETRDEVAQSARTLKAHLSKSPLEESGV